MRCPYCAHKQDKVVDSRESLDGAQVRRRRECLKCGNRFTTYEHTENVALKVIKKDSRRENFDRKKLLSGLMKACEKRPISVEKLEEIVLNIERLIQKKFEREVSSEAIGEIAMEKLALLDHVAYVRFASVYRHFKDVNQFTEELNSLFGRMKSNKKLKRKIKKTKRA
ncbi:MAG: transcriptional regulator NrdR [Candidatus Gygaella obscura]|nr:transcriptional regulator NrdR [Candidatus Gygaella obscura]